MRRIQPLYRIALIVPVLVFIWGTEPHGAQASANVYEVLNVAVDATAESAAAARKLALANGERQAFIQLLQRITPREYHSQLPTPDEATISTYIQDFSVSDEKTSSVRYLANMHVRFRSDDIRYLLSEFGIPFSETISKPVLVVAVLEHNGRYSLWEEDNLWRSVWSQLNNAGRMVPLESPNGDLGDISNIGAQHAISGDINRLRALSQRYNSGSVLVVHASLNTLSASFTGLEVQVSRFGPGFDGTKQSLRFSAEANEPLHTLLSRAARGIADTIEEEWKRDNLMRLDDRGVLAASVPIASLPEWMKIHKRIKGTTIVLDLEVVLLSRDEARINVHYLGGIEQLQVALAQNDLLLSQSEGAWTIGGRAE